MILQMHLLRCHAQCSRSTALLPGACGLLSPVDLCCSIAPDQTAMGQNQCRLWGLRPGT